MRARLRKLLHNERGMSFVFVGLGFMAFLSATTLAIDVGMYMTARSQAQNSADAGALAGAVALAFDDFNDRSASGPAVQNALSAARANQVMREPVDIGPPDVSFLNDATGQPNRVRVDVFRTRERGNPVPSLIASIFGIMDADVSATATAEVSPANAMTCVKPFTIPDKWEEVTDPPWRETSTFERYDRSGNVLSVADIYYPATDPRYTGYNMQANRGQRLMIRASTGNNITASFYFSIAIGGVTGGDPYRWNIRNCNTHVMYWGDPLVQEPGAMAGPTLQGAQDLIAMDPGATWDAATGRVVGSAYPGQSPRVFPIPLYDPDYYDNGMKTGRGASLRVANWIGFFLEEVVGNGIWGRIIPIAGIRDTSAGPVPDGLFPVTIRLVE
jgi:Flp pilus assembly protein TadG